MIAIGFHMIQRIQLEFISAFYLIIALRLMMNNILNLFQGARIVILPTVCFVLTLKRDVFYAYLHLDVNKGAELV